MMELVKVIKAKVGQHCPTKSRDFKKFSPKYLHKKESIFLSFLLTQSAENFSRILGHTGAKFLILS